jgi:hypothetical protein
MSIPRSSKDDKVKKLLRIPTKLLEIIENNKELKLESLDMTGKIIELLEYAVDIKIGKSRDIYNDVLLVSMTDSLRRLLEEKSSELRADLKKILEDLK